jgi:hypothetical protein
MRSTCEADRKGHRSSYNTDIKQLSLTTNIECCNIWPTCHDLLRGVLSTSLLSTGSLAGFRTEYKTRNCDTFSFPRPFFFSTYLANRCVVDFPTVGVTGIYDQSLKFMQCSTVVSECWTFPAAYDNYNTFRSAPLQPTSIVSTCTLPIKHYYELKQGISI